MEHDEKVARELARGSPIAWPNRPLLHECNSRAFLAATGLALVTKLSSLYLLTVVLPTHTSITAVAVCGLVTIFAVGALIYAPAIFGLGFPSRARVRRIHSILILL